MDMNIQSLADLIGKSNNANSSNAVNRDPDIEKKVFVLKSFTSLLSSAQSTGLADPINPAPEPNLVKFLSPNATFSSSNVQGADDSPVCSIPSLRFKRGMNEVAGISSKFSHMDAAAFMLAVPVFADRNDAQNLPVTILRNISQSFQQLLTSRVRSSNAALTKQAYKRNSTLSAETSILINLLHNSAVTPNTVVTSFRVVPSANVRNNCFSNQVSVPLAFEAVMDISLLGKLTTVSFQAPGSITGTFNQQNTLLERVEVELNTIALLEGMMKQARRTVKKTIVQGVCISRVLAKEPLLQRLNSNKSASLSRSSSLRAMIAQQWKSHTNMGDHDNLRSANSSFLNANNGNSSKDPQKSQGGEEPYRLFSWLEGDKMMLQDHELDNEHPQNHFKPQHVLKNEDSFLNFANAALNMPKKKRVSFINNN